MSLAQRVADYPFWYHRLDLGGGVITPGQWDVARIADRLPWPVVEGRRCLDVGTFDGFYAFELERRGAREVVAADIDRWEDADLPRDVRLSGALEQAFAGTAWSHGGGFALAHEALGSSVRREAVSVYDLSPENVGRFDVVVCGSLLLHLRDPPRALEAIRSVCDGVFLSIDAIDPWLTAMLPRRPAARFRGQGTLAQWWNPNAAAHEQWLRAAGFDVLESTRPFVVPRASGRSGPGLRERAGHLVAGALARTRDVGVLHRALLARPGVS